MASLCESPDGVSILGQMFESSLTPVWISLLYLPLLLFDMQRIFSIDKLIGSPFTLDAATTDLSRPSVERLCVKKNLLKRFPSKIWQGCEDAIAGF